MILLDLKVLRRASAMKFRPLNMVSIVHLPYMLKEDRSNGVNETHKLFICVQKLEAEYAELPLVSGLKATIDDVESRALFYEMCHDFVGSGMRSSDAASDIDETLKDFYDRIIVRASVKGSIIKGTHHLVQSKLIRQSDDEEMKLTRKGIKLLYGEESDGVLDSNKATDRYDFVKRIDKT